jgi:hypothetical protein
LGLIRQEIAIGCEKFCAFLTVVGGFYDFSLADFSCLPVGDSEVVVE